MLKKLCVMLMITSCSYQDPVIDTAGRSGTFDESKADQITNDLHHCKMIAKENTKVIVHEGLKPSGHIFRMPIFKVYHKPTRQEIYVSAQDIRR